MYKELQTSMRVLMDIYKYEKLLKHILHESYAFTNKVKFIFVIS